MFVQYDRPCQSEARVQEGDRVEVQLDVTNTGDRAGVEVVQLYVWDEVASVARPIQQLKRFERIALEPGETKTVTFTLTSDDLRFWGLDDAWTVEPGWFTVMVGGSSADAATRTARFELTD